MGHALSTANLLKWFQYNLEIYSLSVFTGQFPEVTSNLIGAKHLAQP